MKYLKLFENFQDSDTLYFFDFDDTLVESPSFEELVIRYKNGEDLPEIGMLLKNSLNLVGKTLNDYFIENGKIFIEDKNESIEIKGKIQQFWVRKGGGLIKMITPNKFHSLDVSFGDKLKSVASEYMRVKNKSIVTGRKEALRQKVERTLSSLGLDKPNYDLYCFPHGNDSSDRVAEWKARTIVEILKKSNFKKAKFYDDKPKWVRRVVLEVEKELPDVEFEGIRVY